MNDNSWDTSDDALGRRLARELPRYGAPPALRVGILEAAAPVRHRRAWLAPVFASAATTLALVLFFVPLLPRIVPADPVQRLVRSVVAEHTRVMLWGARRGDVITTATPWLTQESGIGLTSVFAGDDRLEFVVAEPVYLEGRRGMALHYRDSDGHLLSYVVLPAPGLPVPDRQRLQVGRFRPALLRDSGFSAWVWKQRDLVCFLVADMVSETDLERFKDYFVRVRVATEPFPAD